METIFLIMWMTARGWKTDYAQVFPTEEICEATIPNKERYAALAEGVRRCFPPSRAVPEAANLEFDGN